MGRARRPRLRPAIAFRGLGRHAGAADVVARAAADGMRLMALTDHDTVDGVDEALRAAREHGLRCSPAAGSRACPEFEDLHVCGYELRHDDPALRDVLADFRADRGRRIWAMADRLEELGFVLDRAPLHAREAAGAPLGRPHLADAVLSPPATRRSSRPRGSPARTRCPAVSRAWRRGYVARSRPTVEEAIDVIHAAGGVAVWAHPFWDIADPDTVLAAIARFAASRLDGVEVFYATHDEEQTRNALRRRARARAARHRLGRLPRSAHVHFDRFGAFDLYGLEPVLGPIGA